MNINLQKIQIKETTKNDINDILEVETQAFGHEKEAKLTAQLLTDESARPILSLLAFDDNKAIGHILFTKAKIENNALNPLVYILAPLAVKPEYHAQGIGGLLITSGLAMLKSRGAEIVFVLGHAAYYPKYGFKPNAESMGYPAPYPIPEKYADCWMLQSLTEKELSDYQGKVICADALNQPEHWRE